MGPRAEDLRREIAQEQDLDTVRPSRLAGLLGAWRALALKGVRWPRAVVAGRSARHAARRGRAFDSWDEEALREFLST